jgi:hypothetical protein
MQVRSYRNFNEVKSVVRDRYLEFSEEPIRILKSRILELWKESIDSIIFYGSCLSTKTSKESSTPDFFIIVPSYRGFYRNVTHTLLNRVLTPNTYSITYEGKKGKYNVISTRDFARETSSQAKDIYNLGRLSKRVGIAYTSNEAMLNKIVTCFANAFYTVAGKIYYLLPAKFTLNDFVKHCLNISYVGERRVEADNKIEKLFLSEEKFYTTVYGLILKDFEETGLVERNGSEYSIRIVQGYAMQRAKTKLFLTKSRVRAKLRWPKSMFTFKGWVDVLLAKIERTKGIKLELTEKERKYPLIYGWKYYRKLKKQKLIK